ncbi:conserved hypothetical protein [Ricinus communis]|uniref:Uncharacterized protein n=1 Tax=Ricinus communis TaxID=3988 RepID=B9RPG5_RICCO|nr:conserved hypothetical protein [Ricinus communis]
MRGVLVVVIWMGILLVDHALNISKLLNMAWDGVAGGYGNSSGFCLHYPYLNKTQKAQSRNKKKKRRKPCFCGKKATVLSKGYKKTRENGQGSEPEMASLKRARQESGSREGKGRDGPS